MKTARLSTIAACLTPLLLTSCTQADAPQADAPAPVRAAEPMQSSLRDLDKLYDGVYPWLAKLYDPASGGFYANAATRGAQGFGPDIESTTFALTFLRDDGLLETMPADVRAQMIEFFQARQDPKTGFFADSHHSEIFKNEGKRMRALRFAMEGLEMLGAKPLHPLPGARAPMPATAHLQSDAAFTKWLEARPWQKAWGALDQIYQQTALFKSLPDEREKQIIDVAVDYLKNKQDPQTGLIGGGDEIVQISGAAKLGWFLGEFNRPIPRADALAATTLSWYRGQPEAKAVTMLRNPIEHLADLQPFLSKPLSPADKELALQTTLRLLPEFRQKDGAFSMHGKDFFIGPFDWRAGKAPKPLSDINGTAMAQKSRASAYQLVGFKAPPMAGADEFWQMVENAKPGAVTRTNE